MSQRPTGIYSLPPLILSQDASQSYWPWSGWIAATTVNDPPQSPGDAPTNDNPMFTTTTSELDKYRALFLIVGVLIGAFVLGKR